MQKHTHLEQNAVTWDVNIYKIYEKEYNFDMFISDKGKLIISIVVPMGVVICLLLAIIAYMCVKLRR